MFDVTIGDKAYKAEVSFYTAVLYEAEFRSDLVADLFGVQGQDRNPFSFKGNDLAEIDFTKVSWLSVAKATWAALKTADSSIPSYQAWMKKARGVNFWDLREALMEDASDCFFRSSATEEEEPEED